MRNLFEEEQHRGFYSETHISIETSIEEEMIDKSERSTILHEMESQMAAMQETVNLACDIGNLLKESLEK